MAFMDTEMLVPTGQFEEAARPLRLLSVIIPARDEAGCVAATVQHLHLEVAIQGIPHEIVVVDDGSSDGTWQILATLAQQIDEIVPVRNAVPHAFGRALQRGRTGVTRLRIREMGSRYFLIAA